MKICHSEENLSRSYFKGNNFSCDPDVTETGSAGSYFKFES